MSKQLTIQETQERSIINSETMFCRMTINVTKEKLLEIFTVKYSKVIISEEVGTRNHFHILLIHKDTNSKNARQNLRNYLKESFPELKGNGDYAISETREGTTTRLAAYTIKEGNFVQQGFPQAFVDKLQSVSYKKFDGKKFQDRMNALDEEWYMNKDKDIEHWVRDYLALKIEYNQVLNPRTITPMMNLRQAKKNGIEEFFSKVMADYDRI